MDCTAQHYTLHGSSASYISPALESAPGLSSRSVVRVPAPPHMLSTTPPAWTYREQEPCMHASIPAVQTPRLSKTVKRRNRRRIRKMHMAIEELASAHSAERTPTDDADQDLPDIDTISHEHWSTDDNISAIDVDEETRNRVM